MLPAWLGARIGRKRAFAWGPNKWTPKWDQGSNCMYSSRSVSLSNSFLLAVIRFLLLIIIYIITLCLARPRTSKASHQHAMYLLQIKYFIYIIYGAGKEKKRKTIVYIPTGVVIDGQWSTKQYVISEDISFPFDLLPFFSCCRYNFFRGEKYQIRVSWPSSPIDYVAVLDTNMVYLRKPKRNEIGERITQEFGARCICGKVIDQAFIFVPRFPFVGVLRNKATIDKVFILFYKINSTWLYKEINSCNFAFQSSGHIRMSFPVIKK